MHLAISALASSTWWPERPGWRLPSAALSGPLLGAGDQIAPGQLRWSLDSGRMSIPVVWMVPFLFFYLQVAKLFWRLLGEIQSGTLEVEAQGIAVWLVGATSPSCSK